LLVIYLGLSLAVGMLLGTLFFGGLWWTVQKITGSESPYLISIASFFVRVAVVLAGFYFLLQADWSYLLAALAGFIIARIILTNKLKSGEKPNRAKAT